MFISFGLREDRGEREEWWSSPMDYERESDIETLAIQFAQILKFGKLFKNEKVPNRLEENWWERN